MSNQVQKVTILLSRISLSLVLMHGKRGEGGFFSCQMGGKGLVIFEIFTCEIIDWIKDGIAVSVVPYDYSACLNMRNLTVIL